MAYDGERLREVVERAVPDDAEPLYCTVAGSHLHGVAGPDSDVDLRGVHLVDAERYALLTPVADQVVVNQGGVTEGFEDVPDAEVVSYELRTFGELVADGNFNALELLFADEPLVAAPAAMDPLRAVVEDHLPLDVPRGYVGMARDNYEGDDEERPLTAKTYLYVLRGLLAARYVRDEASVEPDAFALADHGLDDPGLVDDLAAVKCSGAEARPGPDLAARAEAAIEGLFDALDPPEGVDKTVLRDAVDEWMRDVRDRREGESSGGG